jgi:hypothetical protein
MFAGGTIFPIFGQLGLFSVRYFGCKLLNNGSLGQMHEGRLRAIFKANKHYGYTKTI